uniref:CASP-like protein n=1 Tax=Chenopodium quinoa TaxID=63459 RepID=A0A803L358_CHEQI
MSNSVGLELERKASPGNDMERGSPVAAPASGETEHGILAYLLLSSASSAIPMTNRMREGGDNIFTDSCAAAISMSLLAFISLACSSVIAGYKLSTQSFI